MADRFTTVFFDLDATLITDGAAEAATSAARELVARHPELDAEELLTANARIWNGCWADHGVRWMRGEVPADELPREVWRRTLESVGSVDPAILAEAVRLHAQAELAGRTLFDESRAVLTALRERGTRVGLITNGPSDFQRAKLRAVGIEELFDVIVISGDWGVVKPDPEIFRRALALAEADAGAALHVGDSFEADIVGADAVGITALWINRTTAPAPRGGVPHHESATLETVFDLLS